jgi:26S proteasome regulatory subunit N2
MLKQLLVCQNLFLGNKFSFDFLLAHCIDKYTKLQVEKFQSDGTAHVQIDQRLEDIVNRMFQRCFDDKKYKQVFDNLY